MVCEWGLGLRGQGSEARWLRGLSDIEAFAWVSGNSGAACTAYCMQKVEGWVWHAPWASSEFDAFLVQICR